MNGKPVALTMALPSPIETVKPVESFRYAFESMFQSRSEYSFP